MIKHLRFDIFELQDAKFPVQLMNTVNGQRLVQRHETTSLSGKEDIEDVSVNWTVWVKGCTAWMKRPESYSTR
ncbi:hypothetical protein TNCV_2529401 [Trichonephila clavipes]|nr:hypothetical protein TNCV_2529401 [Trichonephila clavipes]